MILLGIALILMISVILIVSITYVVITARHKERMSLLDKGLNPKDHMPDHFMHNTLRIGMLLFGVGLGFISALLLDEYILLSVDNPAIYAGMVIAFGGVSQILFYLQLKNKLDR